MENDNNTYEDVAYNTYEVTLMLIDGYYDHEYNEPRLKPSYFTITADSEELAIKKAKQINTSPLSIWESFATQIG